MWSVDVIKHNILTNDKWTIRGLLALYKYQTDTEKRIQDTIEYNNVGFNGADGKFMSSVAEFYLQRNYLTDKQLYMVRKRIGKYAGQLTKIANGLA